MRPARVLVVDDSVVVRRLLCDFVASDPALELAGTAPNASIALQKIEQIVPDVVVLDVEMPGMDGIAAVAEIRRTRPRLPVIMCSTLTERGAETTLRALAAGATDYVAKPAAAAGAGGALVAEFRVQLLDKLKGLTAGLSAVPEPVRVWTPPPATTALRRAPEVLLIGCSTGGPNALAQIFAAFEEPLPLPLLIVQHMPPVFTKMLAERLSANSRMPAVEGAAGEIVRPGQAYIAPGGFHMTVRRTLEGVVLETNQEPPENSCRPAVDVLFRSAAKVWGPACLASVLTGMGHDGTRGARDVVDAGGTVVVQDSASCVVPSMPSSVAAAGVAAQVVPLSEMAAFLAMKSRRKAA